MEKTRYDVFLSHATLDKPVVEELAHLLRDRGLEPWLDVWNLIPGEPWQEAIEKALEDCAACAVCIGPSGTGPWQNAEMRAAIDLRISGELGAFRVIPVLLPGAVRGEPSRLPRFLRATTWVEFRETLDDERALHRLTCGIQGIPPDAGPSEAVAPGACPYRGLQVFDVDDSLFFFGREALTGWLLDKLRPEDRSGSRFLSIVGPSGSGKSSLARAGLLAALKRGEIPGSDTWPVAVCKPGPEPLQSLSLAFGKAFQLSDASTVLNLSRDLQESPHAFHVATDLHLSLGGTSTGRRLVVLVDQFEEVFTLCPDEAQRRAIIANLLYAATAADGRTVVALTLRSDFYGRCATYPDLAAAVSDRQSLVGPMTREELRSAIERPAYLAGCELQGGLADLLLNEVESQPGSLPLLEHALLQIWQRREGGRRLTIAAYREIGGVAGALEKHAEEVYTSFSEEEKETCRQIFLRLVQVDEQGRATKRRLGLDELAPATSPVKAVVSSLTDARLLTTDQEKQPTVELAHEALLNNWARLKQWIEQDREALRTRRRLDEAVAEWLGKNRDPAFLLEGGRLAQVEEWAEGHKGEMGADARELLAASVAERDRERSRLRKWTIASILAAVMALAAAITALYLRHTAIRQRSIADAGNLAAAAEQPSQKDPVIKLLLSIQAVRLADFGGQPHLPSAEESLRSTLSAFQGSPLPTGKVRAAAVSSDRRWLAVVGSDGSISAWDLGDRGDPIKKLSIPEASTRSVPEQIAVSSGGRWLLIANENGSHLLNLNATGTAKSEAFLKGEDWLSGSDPFSPDGQWLLTRQSDFWLLRTLTERPQSIATLMAKPESFAFSPDGRWLAVLESKRLAVWDLTAPGPNPRFQIPASNMSLTFSADSQWLVARELGHDDTAEAWRISPTIGLGSPLHFDFNSCRWSESTGPSTQDPYLFSRIPDFATCYVLSGERIMRLVSSFNAAALDPQRKFFAASFRNGYIELRYLVSGPRWVGRFQDSPVSLLFFQGSRLISQGGGDPPRVFEVLPGPDVAKIEPLHFSRIPGTVAVSPQGWRLSIDPASHQATFWTARGPQLIAATEQVSQPWIFSLDGHWLAAAGPDGRPRAWRLGEDGSLSSSILFSTQYHHAKPATTLAFSPDLRWLASGDQDGEARLWSLQDPNAEPLPLTNSEGGVAALAFRPDGHVIATADRNVAVRLRDLNDRGLALTDRPEFPSDRLGPVTSLVFLRDGRLALALTGSSDRIKLWPADRQEIFLNSRAVDVSLLVANPQGDRIAGLSSNNRKIQIWSLEDKNLPEPVLLPGPFRTLTFTSDGNGLWTVNDEGLLQRWELRTDKLLETACRAVGRNLTEREWNRYLPSEPYQERQPCPEFPKAFD